MALLPTVHRDTLYFLLAFLRSVAAHAGSIDSCVKGGNKMTSHNLATLFGPNILRLVGFAPHPHNHHHSSNSSSNATSNLPTASNFSSSAAAAERPGSATGHSIGTHPLASKSPQQQQQFVVESAKCAQDRLAIIETVQILIENYDKIYSVIDLIN